jgi:hypothetical protein
VNCEAMKTKKTPFPFILLFCSLLVTGFSGLFGAEPAGAATHNPCIPGVGCAVDTIRIVRMKNGQTEYVLDTLRSGDTLYYRLVTEPSLLRGILYREVEGVQDTLVTSLMDVMNRDYIDLLQFNLQHYQNKVIGGTVMLCTGIIAFGSGILIADNNDKFLPVFGGVVLSLAGIGLTVPGIIGIAHGSSKVHQLRRQIDRLSAGISLDAKQVGISLRYTIP